MTEYFRVYVALLVKLHKLMAQGKGESDEADNIRDAMDDPENRMDLYEKNLAVGLSGDLYMLQGEDMYVKTADEEKPAKRAELDRLVSEKKWPEVLELLRYSIGLTREQVASYRSKAWFDLVPEVAILFRIYADGLDEPVAPSKDKDWYVAQPYLDDDVFVLDCGESNWARSHLGVGSKSMIDLRNVLQVNSPYIAHTSWAISVQYRFLADEVVFNLSYARNKDTDISPHAKNQYDDLMKAWLACRKKYAPKEI